MYNLQTHNLTISHHTEIDENASWNWDEGNVEKGSISILIPQSEIEDIEEAGKDQCRLPSPP